MKQTRVLAFCSLGLVLAFAMTAGAAPRELMLGTGSGRLGQEISVPLTMNSDGDVQGFVAAFDWDALKLKGIDIQVDTITLPIATDVVVVRIADSYAVLGVVMDSDGIGGEIIPAGNGINLAKLKVKALGPSGETEEVVPLTFKDKVYNTVDLGPLLDNIIVIGGMSIGLTDGLVLTDGEVHLLPPPPGTFYANDTTDQNQDAQFGNSVDVDIVMGNGSPVQGFVVSLQNAPGLVLTNVTSGAAATSTLADFIDAQIFADGGTLGVVMELDGIPPFHEIPIGSENKIGLFTYSTPAHECVLRAEIESHKEVFNLTFVDLLYGTPLKENVIVIGGMSKIPELKHGTVTLRPCEKSVVTAEIQEAVGSCELVDDPSQPDPTDPSKFMKKPGPLSGAPGDTVQVGFYYRFPPETILDPTAPSDLIHQIQGMSLAVCYDKSCLSCSGTYSLAGTITEAIGAEFVNVHCQDVDGDRPGELVIGILADALPPFEGQYLPPTTELLKLICVNFTIKDDADCGGTCSIYFCDGANGAGTVPIFNVASVWNHSWPMKGAEGSSTVEIKILGEAKFIRGDCNFNAQDHIDSTGKDAVDIADASAILSWLFQDGTWQFIPTCLDACDANDDGRVDLADSVYILRYLFKFDKAPPEPFENSPGPDSDKPDRLDCVAGTKC